MAAKTLALLFAVALSTCLVVQGMSIAGHGQRCICGEKKARSFPVGRVVKLEIYTVSHRCTQKEVVITLKTGPKICLDYNSKIVRSKIDGVLRRRFSQNV